MKKYIDFIKEYGLLLWVFWVPIVWIIWSLISAVLWDPQPVILTGKQQVHWHMPISYDLCGDTAQLQDSGKHGKLHGHNDGKIHVEWFIDANNRSETLWSFFQSANIPFSQNQIWKYKNGDTCPWSDTPWKVRVLVNGNENKDFENYILNDKDDIKVIFK